MTITSKWCSVTRARDLRADSRWSLSASCHGSRQALGVARDLGQIDQPAEAGSIHELERARQRARRPAVRVRMHLEIGVNAGYSWANAA